jgi:hypothetical protein
MNYARNNIRKKGKKIVQSKEIEIDGIKFKSGLEGDFYKEAKNAGLNPQYEPFKITLLESTKNINVLCLEPFKIKNENKYRFEPKITTSLLPMTYTADFIIKKDDVIYIIETKGRANERFPVVKKLLKLWISKQTEKYIYIQPQNKQQIKQTINFIKNN